MARQPDPGLEERILNAARQLWKNGSSKALTMRAVARAARTNTPAVYRRFPHRDDILRALVQETRQDWLRLVETSSSVEDACERYLDYGLSHPHEYELYYLHEYELLRSSPKMARRATLNQTVKQERPVVQLMKGKLAAQLGGSPDDYTRLEIALWALLHGAVMLLIMKTIRSQHEADMRSICRASVATLLREASRT
ncbi:MAG: TetR/AcrR family transcriptional regulator [Terriglobales bacterium]